MAEYLSCVSSGPLKSLMYMLFMHEMKLFRNKLAQLTQREQREIEAERRRRVREMKLRRYLQERLPEETPRESPAEKKKKFR